jgi:hypothetical protein
MLKTKIFDSPKLAAFHPFQKLSPKKPKTEVCAFLTLTKEMIKIFYLDPK